MAGERILLVEDDARLGGVIAEYLREQGLAVDVESRGERAVERILGEQPDLVILDLMLPGIDGFEVFRQVRPGFGGRILFLTARRADPDHVAALEMGADDYVTKPVDPRVLLARVHSLLRRGVPTEVRDDLRLGDLRLDRRTRRGFVRDQEVGLTSAEFDLLWLLALRAGRVVSRENLYRAVLGTEYNGLDRGIDVHVSRIRKKLKDAGLEADPIRSVRGAGYQLAVRP